jgi:hypothetical protein
MTGDLVADESNLEDFLTRIPLFAEIDRVALAQLAAQHLADYARAARNGSTSHLHGRRPVAARPTSGHRFVDPPSPLPSPLP